MITKLILIIICLLLLGIIIGYTVQEDDNGKKCKDS